ncbi:acetyl-CoA carboxylase biotin carboxyl carrier protein [Lewinella cohaerens]|uniref:acetyl-CoA carboxylase biotin carboxyl carrier protein n=1 Tax=Lewinella cohaerens TaxID=70995 RepID=UPI0003815DAA|nr:acetyl-CoA carboxylase biotin carboxyl carrier protein [Lewinella cohaerens]
MSTKEIQDLLKLVSKLELSEFKMKEGEFSLSVRTKHFVAGESSQASAGTSAPLMPMPAATPTYAPPAPVAAAAPSAPAPSKKEEAPVDDESNYLAVKSPMVGTFYRSPSPDKPIYVKIGDTIASGDTVCIIEAMKLFNEVESEVSGKIVKVLVEDAQPVEYDQVLFLVDPKG